MHEIPDEIAEKATSIQLGARLFVHVPAELGRSLAAENGGVVPSYEQLAARSSVCVDEGRLRVVREAMHRAMMRHDSSYVAPASWDEDAARLLAALAAVSSPPEPETDQ